MNTIKQKTRTIKQTNNNKTKELYQIIIKIFTIVKNRNKYINNWIYQNNINSQINRMWIYQSMNSIRLMIRKQHKYFHSQSL